MVAKEFLSIILTNLKIIYHGTKYKIICLRKTIKASNWKFARGAFHLLGLSCCVVTLKNLSQRTRHNFLVPLGNTFGKTDTFPDVFSRPKCQNWIIFLCSRGCCCCRLRLLLSVRLIHKYTHALTLTLGGGFLSLSLATQPSEKSEKATRNSCQTENKTHQHRHTKSELLRKLLACWGQTL